MGRNWWLGLDLVGYPVPADVSGVTVQKHRAG